MSYIDNETENETINRLREEIKQLYGIINQIDTLLFEHNLEKLSRLGAIRKVLKVYKKSEK